jgi:hypothetical protein
MYGEKYNIPNVFIDYHEMLKLHELDAIYESAEKGQEVIIK